MNKKQRKKLLKQQKQHKKQTNSDKILKLANSRYFIQDRTLSLYQYKLTNIDIKYIVNKSWRQVQILKLNDNCIGDQGMRYLIKGNWKNLGIAYFSTYAKIILDQNVFTGECMKYFTRGIWPSLISISFQNNSMSACSLLEFACVNCSKLDTVWIANNSFGLNFQKYLTQALPHLSIEHI